MLKAFLDARDAWDSEQLSWSAKEHGWTLVWGQCEVTFIPVGLGCRVEASLCPASVKERYWAWGLTWRQVKPLAEESSSLLRLLPVLHSRLEKGRSRSAQRASPGCSRWWWQKPLSSFTLHAGHQLVPLDGTQGCRMWEKLGDLFTPRRQWPTLGLSPYTL